MAGLRKTIQQTFTGVVGRCSRWEGVKKSVVQGGGTPVVNAGGRTSGAESEGRAKSVPYRWDSYSCYHMRSPLMAA